MCSTAKVDLVSAIGADLGGFDQIRARLLSPFVGQTLTTFISPENYEGMIELRASSNQGRHHRKRTFVARQVTTH